MKKKLIIIFIALVFFIGGTYALIRKTVFNQNAGFTISGLDAYIIYNKGTDVLTGTLSDTETYSESNLNTEITLYKNATFDIYGHIYLDLKTIGANLSEENALKWVIKSNNNIINSGNFIGYAVNDSIPLALNIPLSSSQQKFQIYIWLDKNVIDNFDISGESLRTIVRAEATQIPINIEPNKPELTDGLIPVKYDTTNSRWVKADSANTNNDWYNYNNKLWANAVLVSSTNRSTYMSANAGIEIPESDVLAYYVWIPRFKYKVWNINKVMGVDSYNAETNGIDIVFENGNESTGTISCNYNFAITNGSLSEICSGSNGDYYTHPAFTFGNDELTGLWIGKFELSSETPNISYGGGNVTNLTPRIKPNVHSWRRNIAGNYWKVIHDMQTSNNIYGLTSDTSKTDSHMIKNTEWGAIVYFTNSKYGICNNNVCDTVYKNNSNTFITGNSGKDAISPSISGTTLAYNENKKNITIVGGTPLNLSAPVNDATYPWTQSNGIWSSGNAGVVESTSTLTYSFTNSSNAVIKLIFSVCSYYSHYLKIYLDGTEIMKVSDSNRGTEEENLIYDTFLYEISSGTHILEIKYVKDVLENSSVVRLDKGYIKSLEILEGATINVTHTNELGGQMASTTHNESGIYDLNGAAWEYVMANMSSEYGSYIYNQSEAGVNFDYSNDTKKYIDRYAYSNTKDQQADYNRTILGDAIGEVSKTSGYSWNGDYGQVIYSTDCWFLRGGHWWNNNVGGIFNSVRNTGKYASHFSTRAALVPLK